MIFGKWQLNMDKPKDTCNLRFYMERLQNLVPPPQFMTKHILCYSSFYILYICLAIRIVNVVVERKGVFFASSSVYRVFRHSLQLVFECVVRMLSISSTRTTTVHIFCFHQKYLKINKISKILPLSCVFSIFFKI